MGIACAAVRILLLYVVAQLHPWQLTLHITIWIVEICMAMPRGPEVGSSLANVWRTCQGETEATHAVLSPSFFHSAKLAKDKSRLA